MLIKKLSVPADLSETSLEEALFRLCTGAVVTHGKADVAEALKLKAKFPEVVFQLDPAQDSYSWRIVLGGVTVCSE